jgi:hypothetical protein
MSRRPHIPSYRLHKQSGQAVVTLPDGFGGRRDVLLGKHGSPESRAEYARVLGEWEANGRRPPQTDPAPSDLTSNELALVYWNWAVAYHRWDKRGGFCLKGALKVIKDLYGHTVAREFGPLALKACRNKMIALDWSRSYVNSQVDRLRRMFRWAAEHPRPRRSAGQAGRCPRRRALADQRGGPGEVGRALDPAPRCREGSHPALASEAAAGQRTGRGGNWIDPGLGAETPMRQCRGRGCTGAVSRRPPRGGRRAVFVVRTGFSNKSV